MKKSALGRTSIIIGQMTDDDTRHNHLSVAVWFITSDGRRRPCPLIVIVPMIVYSLPPSQMIDDE